MGDDLYGKKVQIIRRFENPAILTIIERLLARLPLYIKPQEKSILSPPHKLKTLNDYSIISLNSWMSNF
jgi:hypothetical protein